MYDPATLRPGTILLMERNPREALPAQALDVLIAASEGNPLVHAAIVGEGHIVDPVWTVRDVPLDTYAANGWVFRVAATDAERAAAVAWAEARIGQGYGLGELAEDAARFDLHLVLPAWYKVIRPRMTCSGFISAAYASAGVRLSYAPAIAPSDLSYSPLLIGTRPWEV